MKKSAILLCALLIFPFMLRSQPPTESDISYGPLDSEKLDYWEATDNNSPIVLIIPGKDWASGNKELSPWRDAVSLFHENGYAVVIINYVLSSDADYQGFPQQPANLACAIGWTKEHASQLKGDPQQLILIGTSAGAHLAALHALRPAVGDGSACEYSGADMDVTGVIALSGLYDFRVVPKESRSQKFIRTMVGDSTAYWKSAQPVEVQPSGNPDVCFFLMHGTRDAFAGNAQPDSFEKYLTNNGYCVKTEILENRESDLINDLADPASEIAKQVITFANSISGQEEEDNETPTAVLPPGDPARLKVYPNPTERDLYVLLEPASYRYAELILTAIDGREILHTRKQYTEQIKLDIHQFPRGTYILNILTDKDKHQRKIVIN